MNDTRIVELKHIPGDWHQYDIKLNFGYGWGYILKSAAQLIQKDLLSVDTITTVDAKTREAKELIDAYNAAGQNLEECKEARTEAGAFAVGGNSSEFKLPTKVIWFNQTQVLRVFTIMEVSEQDVRNYVSKYILLTM